MTDYAVHMKEYSPAGEVAASRASMSSEEYAGGQRIGRQGVGGSVGAEWAQDEGEKQHPGDSETRPQETFLLTLRKLEIENLEIGLQMGLVAKETNTK